MARILLLDDDIAEITAVKRLVARTAHRVQLATTAADASGAIERDPPDLLVVASCCDDGQALSVVREAAADGATSAIPVIVLGDAAGLPARVGSLALPIDPEQLRREIERLLAGSSVTPVAPVALATPVAPAPVARATSVAPAPVARATPVAPATQVTQVTRGTPVAPAARPRAHSAGSRADRRGAGSQRGPGEHAGAAEALRARAAELRGATGSARRGLEPTRTPFVESENGHAGGAEDPRGWADELAGLGAELGAPPPEPVPDKDRSAAAERAAADVRQAAAEAAVESRAVAERRELPGRRPRVDEEGRRRAEAEEEEERLRAAIASARAELEVMRRRQAPAARAPALPEPAASEPAASETAASEIAAYEPAASELGASERTAPEPAVSVTAAFETTASEPAVPEIAAPEPTASEPAVPEPAAPDTSASDTSSNTSATETAAPELALPDSAPQPEAPKPAVPEFAAPTPQGDPPRPALPTSPSLAAAAPAPVTARAAPSLASPAPRRVTPPPVPSLPPPPDELRAGTLAELPAPRLLALAAQVRLAGRLDLEGDVARSLWFEGGRVVGATSADAAERIEALAVRLGLVTRDQRQQVASQAASLPARRAALLLLDAGFLKPAELGGLVRRRTEEVVFGIFGDAGARFRWTADEVPADERGAVERSPLALAVEGVRRRWSAPRLDPVLGGPDTLLTNVPEGPPADALGLSPEERQVAALADGLRTVEEIERASPLDALATRQVLAALVQVGAVAVRRLAARASPEATREIDLARLADKLDQARRCDYFTVLGLSRSSTSHEVREAALLLEEALEPGRLGGTPGEALAGMGELLQVVRDAREVLGDDRLRQAYLTALGD